MAWPTTDEPRTNFVTVRLTDAEHDDLLWLQGRMNVKDRSAAVRNSIDLVVAAERRREKKEKAARSD